MKRFLSRFSAALVVIILFAAFLLPAKAAARFYKKGDTVEDFTFKTYDGQAVTLSEVLKKKEAVLINIWASWCGPCRSEFPYMQEAYAQYQDRVEIFALSCEPTDTDDTLAAFANNYQLTFKIGQDPVDFLSALGVSSIPTSLMIDRFGTICFVESGAMPDVDSFTRLFDAFLGDDYTESILFDAIPPNRPAVAPSNEVALAQALNIEGGSIAFANPSDKLTWPMVVVEKDGRSVVASSNKNVQSSAAAVNAHFTAKSDEALVVTFKVSSEPVHDAMQIRVNGEVVKSFAGSEDWQTYAYQIPADGEYKVEVAYSKNAQGSAGDDMLWVDSIALVGGNEAAEALANNPAYPVAGKISILAVNDSARKITINDPTGNIFLRYGASEFYLIPDEKALFSFSMVEEFDPETAIVYFNYDGRSYALSDCLVNGQYSASSGGDSIQTTGYCDSSVILYPDLYTPGTVLTYFKSEIDIDAFLSALTTDYAGKVRGSWTYADIEPLAAPADHLEKASEVTYTLRCVDQDGNPVNGAMLQICDEDTCQVLRADENGVCAFTGAPYAWEIHVLKAPEGYTAESTNMVYAPVTGGEIVFTFYKN